MMFGGVIAWIIWLVLTIVAFVAFVTFLRGMHALVQIASRHERIEHVLAARNAASGERAP